MRIKLVLFLIGARLCSQAQQADTVKINASKQFDRVEAYVFYDLIRLAGVGLTCNTYSSFSFDLRVACLYPNKLADQFIHANDYFYSTGVSFSVMPKWFLNPTGRVYFGLYNALNFYGYKKEMADEGADYHYSTVQGELRDKQTLGYTILSPTIGALYRLKKINLEWFVSVGRERTQNKFTVYSRADYYWHPLKSNPEIYTEDVKQINVVLGIKIGFGLKSGTKAALSIYETKLREKLKNEEATIDEMLTKGKISATDYWDEYIPFRDEKFKTLKKEFRKKRSDTKYMDDLTEKLYSEIEDYIEKKFNFRYQR